MSDSLKNFRFHHSIQVRYSDMDMLGHANNAVYLTYLELARLEYFREVNTRSDANTALVLVAIDTQTGRPVAISEAEKQKITAYEPALA